MTKKEVFEIAGSLFNEAHIHRANYYIYLDSACQEVRGGAEVLIGSKH